MPLRNSLHRRNHKERSQLANRTRLGILEKHKDYVLRAKDYHSKQDRLQRLQQKAVERNKDEFYFSMTRERTQNGVHIKDRGNPVLPEDVIKVLKTQDENYIRTMRASGQKKIDQIKAQLNGLVDPVHPLTEDSEELEGFKDSEIDLFREADVLPSVSSNSKRHSRSKGTAKHIIFADSMEEASAYMLQPEDTSKLGHQNIGEKAHQSLADASRGWKIASEKKRGKQKMPDTSTEELEEFSSMDVDEEGGSAMVRRKKLLRELASRLLRDKQLRYVMREFEMQRLMMGKGARRKIQGREKVEGEESPDEDDEDALDARGGRALKDRNKTVDNETWRPRVYKWKLERKK